MNDSENRTENEIAINAIDSVLIQECEASSVSVDTISDFHDSFRDAKTQMVSDGRARDRLVCMHRFSA